METPRKTDWFVEWLDEKFDGLKALIEDNRVEHTKAKNEIHEKIAEVDEYHKKQHKYTRKFFIVLLLIASFIFIKESRDIIIKFLF